MAYVEIPCKDPEEVIMFDPLTCKYFLTSVTHFTPLTMLASNKFTLHRQALVCALYSDLSSVMERYRKKVEEEERRERKRIKNRKKRERMKRLRVKKVKR